MWATITASKSACEGYSALECCLTGPPELQPLTSRPPADTTPGKRLGSVAPHGGFSLARGWFSKHLQSQSLLKKRKVFCFHLFHWQRDRFAAGKHKKVAPNCKKNTTQNKISVSWKQSWHLQTTVATIKNQKEKKGSTATMATQEAGNPHIR